MEKAKELIKEKQIIEEKLTNAEISYNKVNYLKKTINSEIRSLEKDYNRGTKEGIAFLTEKVEKQKSFLVKEKIKLDKIKNKTFLSSSLKKSNIKAQTYKIHLEKTKLKHLEKKLYKASKISESEIKSLIKKLESKLESMQEELINKKEKVFKYRKKYKNLRKEWNKIFPEIDDSIILSVENLDVFYGSKQALFNVSMNFPRNEVIAIIGPSGCGKSTFLKTLNRINEEIPSFKAKGKILLSNEINILTGKNIYDDSSKMTLPELRTKIGMVFQQPNPFPMSIFKNVAYGPKINGIKNRSVLKEIVTVSLKKAAIYEQVKDNLGDIATGLSGGQQQRLCIARAIANSPKILLMDEPTSALDPIAAAKVEDLILELKKDYTIIMVTHSMQQAARISDRTAFFYQGELIEYGKTKKLFTKPKEKRTDDYIRGKFG